MGQKIKPQRNHPVEIGKLYTREAKSDMPITTSSLEVSQLLRQEAEPTLANNNDFSKKSLTENTGPTPQKCRRTREKAKRCIAATGYL
jgi:hypothetical protein